MELATHCASRILGILRRKCIGTVKRLILYITSFLILDLMMVNTEFVYLILISVLGLKAIGYVCSHIQVLCFVCSLYLYINM